MAQHEQPDGIHEFCPFADPEFQRNLLKDMATLIAEARVTNTHLAHLNGKIEEQAKEIAVLKQWKAYQEGGEKATGKWTGRLMPAAWALAWVLIALLLYHGKEVLALAGAK